MNFAPCRSLWNGLILTIIGSLGSFGATSCYGQRSSLYANPGSVEPSVSAVQPASALVQLQSPLNAGTPSPMIPNAGQVIAGVPPYSPMPQHGPIGQDFAAASWIHTPVPPPRILRIHDLINIRVDETAQTQQSGTMQSRKNAALDLLLTDWVQFEGLSLKPAAQEDGNPRAAGINNEVYRADSNLRTRESMAFNITAEIADIRPNGLLVLSARKQIKDNDNTWELSLSGICRPEDVGPDNVVLSRAISELEIDKNEVGHVREGYARGWISRLFGKFKPF